MLGTTSPLASLKPAKLAQPTKSAALKPAVASFKMTGSATKPPPAPKGATASFTQTGSATGPPKAAPKAAVAPAPPAPASPSAGSAQALNDAYLDSTYYANVGANQFKVGNDITTDQGKIGTENTTLADNLAKLAQAQQLSNTNDENAENARGGYALGNLSQTLGNLNTQYLQKQGAAQSTHDSDVNALNQDIANLQNGLPVYQQSQAAEALGRYQKATAADPNLGQLAAAPAAPKPVAPKPVAKTAPKPVAKPVAVAKAKAKTW